jgi:hypothetical protein
MRSAIRAAHGLLKTIRDRIARRRRDHPGMQLALLLERSRPQTVRGARQPLKPGGANL